MSWAFSLAAGQEALFGHIARQCVEQLKARARGWSSSTTTSAGRWWPSPPASASTAEQILRLRYFVDGEARSRWNFRKNGPLLSNKAKADTRLLSDLVNELGLQSVMIAPMTRGTVVPGPAHGGRPRLARGPSPTRT